MTTRITVFFEPLDVLQFRDHRPFDIGEHTVARTVFPGPATFRGALRTLLFLKLGARFELKGKDDHEHFGIQPGWAQAWLGGRRAPGSIAIRGPLLARLTPGAAEPFEPFFHAPRDIVPERQRATGTDDSPDVSGEPGKESVKTRKMYRPLLAHAAEGELAQVGPKRFRWTGSAAQEATSSLPWSDVEPEKDAAVGYLTLAGARAYLAGHPKGVELQHHDKAAPLLSVKENRLLRHEPRVGIARDPSSLTAEDRMFYLTAPYRAAPDVGFAIDVEIPTEDASDATRRLLSLNGSITPLGGKAHRARVHVFEHAIVPPDLAADRIEGPRRVWLQTALRLPASFPEGTLVIADRTVPVGGFDFARGAPRALRAALAPGTVLHLPPGARWPLSTDDVGTGYGFALAGPVPQRDSSSKGESR